MKGLVKEGVLKSQVYVRNLFFFILKESYGQIFCFAEIERGLRMKIFQHLYNHLPSFLF